MQKNVIEGEPTAGAMLGLSAAGRLHRQTPPSTLVFCLSFLLRLFVRSFVRFPARFFAFSFRFFIFAFSFLQAMNGRIKKAAIPEG